jgi:hypothetical protein
MQARYAVVRATVLHYTLPVLIFKKTPLPYGDDSEEESDGPPPSSKKTDATEMKIDKSLKVFIEALPHLEPLHYGFKVQALNEKGYCFCSLAKCLTPWRKQYHIVIDRSLCGVRLFKVLVFFNIVARKVMNITQQLPFILQHCLKRNGIDTGFCPS